MSDVAIYFWLNLQKNTYQTLVVNFSEQEAPLASALAKLTAVICNFHTAEINMLEQMLTIGCSSHLVCEGTGSESHLCWHVGAFLNPIGCGHT